MEEKIAIYKCDSFDYSKKETLFRPDTKYPEYRFEEVSKEKNMSYQAVRECFRLLRLDDKNFGTKKWNPLGVYIRPGDYVLIKPNLVMDANYNKKGKTTCLYTQPDIVAAVVDYVLIALKGGGKIIIGDAPMQSCNFEKLKEQSGYDILEKYYQNKGYNLKIVDFRELSSVKKNGVLIQSINDNSKGTVVQLGKESDFYGLPKKQENRIRITNYDPRILPLHHQGEIHEYYVSDYMLKADVIINMPKPKTHRKAGVTISLKNFVGVCIRKEYLPHHTLGAIAEQGDEYLKKNIIHKIRSRMIDKKNIYIAEKRFKKALIIHFLIKPCSMFLKITGNKYSEGSWYGNHTICKTICDLNKIVMYADKNGIMQANRQRKVFIVADMIVSGEKEGPLAPSSKNVGIVAAGENLLQFDESIAMLMGFDPKRIPTFYTMRQWKGKYLIYKNEDNSIFVSNDKRYNMKKPAEIGTENQLHYEAAAGWKGHIEKQVK